MDDRRVIPFPGQPGQADPETDLGRTQVRVILQRVIDRLPVSFRMVFVLRDIEELSSEEVADHLGLNAETVRTRLFRARRLLQQALRHEFSAGMGDLFPFNGPRCERLTDRVLAALTEQA